MAEPILNPDKKYISYCTDCGREIPLDIINRSAECPEHGPRNKYNICVLVYHLPVVVKKKE